MLDRPRYLQALWALTQFALVGLILVLVQRQWEPLVEFDSLGRDGTAWASQYGWLQTVMHVIEDAFDWLAMVIYSIVIGVWLWVRNHRRAAIFGALLVPVTHLVTQVVKRWVDRPRPPWQSDFQPIEAHTSFPSGHSSTTTALAMVAVVLAAMFLRKSAMRRVIYVGAGLLVAIMWADRVLQGRHYLSDVIAGSLLAVGTCFAMIAVYNPLPKVKPVAPAREPLALGPGPSRKLAVVLNPIKVEDVSQFRSVVTSIATECGWQPPIWHYTTIEDPGTGMAAAAAESGADLVIVCGGDGTVREVCAELAGTGIPVGIVPAGTGNLLARNLDIPLYLRAAIDVALNGQDRAIDLVAVDGDGFESTHFMVMAGMGFDAAIMEGVNDELKKRVGWIAYVASGLKSLMFPAVRLDISIDDQPPTRHRARTVVVGNVGYLQAGMPLLPDAAIDDGVLDVVLIHPRRFRHWIPVALRVLAKSATTDDTINRLTGQKVHIVAHSDTPRQLDGDSVGEGRELTAEVIHGRLLVRVPR